LERGDSDSYHNDPEQDRQSRGAVEHGQIVCTPAGELIHRAEGIDITAFLTAVERAPVSRVIYRVGAL
jgi:hypothetical protein